MSFKHILAGSVAFAVVGAAGFFVGAVIETVEMFNPKPKRS